MHFLPFCTGVLSDSLRQDQGSEAALHRPTPPPAFPPQGKVFPKLRKRSSMRTMDVEEMGTGRATDYVFRIIYPGHRHEHSECLNLHPWRKRERRLGRWGSAVSPRRGGRQGPFTDQASRQTLPCRSVL